MDSWNKFKTKSHKENLTTVSIPKMICYGNYLCAEIMWLAVENKLKQKHVDKFFDVASLVLQATKAQSGLKDVELYEIHNYIEQIVKDIDETKTTFEDLAIMLGNLSEIENAKYTFTELIAFVRVLAKQI
jgi:hypothetical protein